jgi:hypothetical protein
MVDVKTPAGSLVARVQVNRIWQHLFGRGIVATDDNFGAQGRTPTHPELLDWLAARFAADGWRVKPLLRMLMTSDVYKQASAGDDPKAAEADPGNDLLWRMRLRRLESESVRDAILAVSGKLDRTMGGTPVLTAAQPDGSVIIKEDSLPTPTAKWRRSLYLLARRNYHPALLGVFDQPIVATNCTGRQSAAVVTQSLTMLNNAVVLEQSDAFADRVIIESGNDDAKAIDLAFRLALTRSPRGDEQSWCADFLRGHQPRREAIAQLCHVLFNSSEFLYVP